MATGIAEVFGHGTSSVRGEVLERGGVGGGGGDDRGVLQRARILQRGNDLADRGRLLTDSDVEAENVLPLLVDDRVDRDGGLARSPVADDQFALTTSDGNHGIDGFDARLQRFLDRLAIDDAGGDHF